MKHAEGIIKRLNPHANILITDHCNAPVETILQTQSFDFVRTVDSAGIDLLLHGMANFEIAESGSASDARSGNEVDGVVERARKRRKVRKVSLRAIGFSSFSYHRKAPFHPVLLANLLRQTFVVCEMGNTHTVATGVERHASYLGTVIRSKGFIWLGSCKDTKVLWNQAGKVCNLTHVGPWRNAEEDWILSFIGYNDSMKEIDERRQELVFIGIGMDKARIMAALDACLIPWPEDDEQQLSEVP